MFVSTPRDIVCHAEMERAVLFARKQMAITRAGVMDSWLGASRRPGRTNDMSRSMASRSAAAVGAG